MFTESSFGFGHLELLPAMGFGRRDDPEEIPAYDQCDMSGHLPLVGKQAQLPKIKQALLYLPFLLIGPA